MEAKDLRIGNYIDYETEREIVTMQTTYEYIRLIHNGNKNFKPIPLTEEWLLKFGFEEYEFEDEVFGYVLNDFGYINEYQFRIRIFIDFEGIIIPKAIKTVHELQNLYFALTNEELTL
jgi:hypothetical protein